METSNNINSSKVYTYNNWWDGDVTLVFATRYFDKGDEPIMVNWEDFNASDVERIKEKQSELFKEGVNTLLKPITKQFIKRYEASEMKSSYIKAERQECWNVMFGAIPNSEIVHLNHWKISFNNQYLSDVQDYIERTIKNGIDDGLGFIHSPNCKYQDTSRPDSRIYAKFVSVYFKWLKIFKLKQEASKKKPQQTEHERLQKEPISLNDSNEILQNRIWFKVGLHFANGDMDYLIKKHTKNCSSIARELGNKNFRPYISESLSGTNINNKNIFSSEKKTNSIISYCKSKGITVVDSFHERIK